MEYLFQMELLGARSVPVAKYQIVIHARTYASGRPFWLVQGVNGGYIGTIERRGEDYIAAGHRKPVLTLGEAARQVVRARVKRLIKEVAALSAALEPTRDKS